MRRDVKLFSAFYIFLFVLSLQGCASEPTNKTERMQLRSLLVLPVRSLHDELLIGGDAVHQRLLNELDALEFQVELLPENTVVFYEDQALEVSGSVYSPKIGQFVALDESVYQYHLIQMLAKDYEFDAVILPQLTLRTTKVNIDEAEWDGVSREIEFVNKPDRLYKLPKSAKGVSVRLSAFSRNGAKISSGFGGLALPYKIDFIDGKSAFSLKESFYHESEINQAIEIALKSFNTEVEAQ